MSVEFVPISQIRMPAYVFRERLDIDGLVKSVRQKGILENLIVRQIEDEKFGFELVSGWRRLNAARKAGLTSVPAKIVEADDKEAFEIALTENVQRNNLSPLEIAKAARFYREKGWGERAELARKLGKTRAWLSQYESLLDLSPKLLTRVNNSEFEIPIGRLVEIARLPKHEDQEAVFEAAGNLPKRELGRVVSKMKGENVPVEEALRRLQEEKEEVFIKRLAEELAPVVEEAEKSVRKDEPIVERRAREVGSAAVFTYVAKNIKEKSFVCPFCGSESFMLVFSCCGNQLDYEKAREVMEKIVNSK